MRLSSSPFRLHVLSFTLLGCSASLARTFPCEDVPPLTVTAGMSGRDTFTIKGRVTSELGGTLRFEVQPPGSDLKMVERAVSAGPQTVAADLNLRALGVPRFRDHARFQITARFIGKSGQQEATTEVTVPLPVVTVHGIRPLPGSPRFPELEAGLADRSREAWGPLGAYRSGGDYLTLHAFEWESNGLTLAHGSDRLTRYVRETIRRRTYADRVYIVAHSRGGNLTREWLARTAGKGDHPYAAGAVLACVPTTGAADATRLTSGAWRDLLPTWPWTRRRAGEPFRATPSNPTLRRLNARKPATGTDLLLLYGVTEGEGDTDLTHTGPEGSPISKTRTSGDRYVTAYSARGIEVVPDARQPQRLTERPVVRNLAGAPVRELRFRRSFPSPGYLHTAFLSQRETHDAIWEWLSAPESH